MRTDSYDFHPSMNIRSKIRKYRKWEESQKWKKSRDNRTSRERKNSFREISNL